MNLGVLPARHALYEWNVYIPAYGEVIQSLAFSPLGRRAPDACLGQGYDPARLVEVHETVHQRLARHGVRSIQFAHRSYADSAYNRIASAGAEIVRHGTLAEALVQLKEALTETDGKALLGFYWAGIDTIAHMYGPGTPYHAAEIASFWRTFDEVMRDIDSPETLYLFTADHGHVYADRDETIYINERFPELADCLAVSPTGNPIYPNGSPRDMFPPRAAGAEGVGARSAAQAPRRHRARHAGRRGAGGRPVRPAAGMRGAAPRLGDILVLPRLGHFIWWREPGLHGKPLLRPPRRPDARGGRSPSSAPSRCSSDHPSSRTARCTPKAGSAPIRDLEM